MFSVGYISQMIGKNLCVANLGINVSMRMSVNPIVDAGDGNVVAQFHSESTIYKAVAKYWCSCCSIILNMSYFLNNSAAKIHKINKLHKLFYRYLNLCMSLVK